MVMNGGPVARHTFCIAVAEGPAHATSPCVVWQGRVDQRSTRIDPESHVAKAARAFGRMGGVGLARNAPDRDVIPPSGAPTHHGQNHVRGSFEAQPC